MTRLLCVGSEDEPLPTRCEVLRTGGYMAEAAVLSGAESILHRERFDLVIFSAWLNEQDRERILTAAGDTPVLLLTELTLPDRLLTEVERLLQQ